MIYVISLYDIRAYKNLAEANAKEGYVHPDDAYPTKLAALKVILESTEEDLIEMKRQKAEAETWISQDIAALERVKKQIRAIQTGRKRK